MKKKRKSIELDEQKRRLLVYLNLLAAAVFITIHNPEGLWLPIGLTVGIAVDQILFLKKKKEDAKNAISLDANEKVNDETIGK